MQKLKRTDVASFLNVGTKIAPDFRIVGVGVTSYGVSYNPQVKTEKWIIYDNANSEVESYQLQGDISQMCYKGDPIFDFINELRRTLAVGDKAKAEVVDVDIFDGNKATKFDCTIAITNYMSEEAVIEYSVYYNGNPVLGTVVVDEEGKATFTEDGSL